MAENDTITARLPDGRTAKFPKGTTPEEMTEAVNAMAAGDNGAASAPVSDDPIGDQIKQHLRAGGNTDKSAGWFKEALSGIGRGLMPIAQLPQAVLESFTPNSPTEFALGPQGTLAKRMIEGIGNQLETASNKTLESIKQGENLSGQTLTYMENAPVIGPVVRKAEEAGPGYAKFEPSTLGAITEGVTSIEAPEAIRAGLGSAVRLKEAARSQLQRATGGSSIRTTRPIVEKYGDQIAKHAADEQAATAALATENQKIAAKNVTKSEAFKAKASDVISGNLEQTHFEGRRSGLETSLQKGSKELGKRIQSLDENLRQEGNEKYQTVRTATANDPGVPIDNLLTSLKAIEDSVPKGSEESIRQIRDLFKKYTDNPDRPNIGFNDLQGYSSEIGAKLSTGNLPGDLYQALKGVKEQLDASKRMIAERNGAGDALNDADNFWHQYQSTFYDRPSAVAAVRGKVGEIDPEFYAAPFIKGKGGGVGIGNLRTLPTKYAAEARATADLAQNLRDAHEELGGMGRTKVAKEVPAAPTTIPPKTRTAEPPPTAPTLQDLTHAKAEKILATGSRVHPYLLGSSIISLLTAPFTGRIGGSVEVFGGLQLIDRLLSNEKVVDWLSKPTAADIKAIKNLPEPTQTQLRTSIETSLKRKPGLKVSPDLMRAVGIAAAASRPVANRQDALDRLKSSAHDAGLGIRP